MMLIRPQGLWPRGFFSRSKKKPFYGLKEDEALRRSEEILRENQLQVAAGP